MVVFDTYAWIEYFEGSKKGEKVREFIEDSEEIFTPAVCLAEIKSKYLKEGRDYRERIQFITKRSVIVDIDAAVSLLGADLKQKYRLYLIDALVYASAEHLKQSLVSGDQHFKSLSRVIFLE